MNSKPKRSNIVVTGSAIAVLSHDHQDFICLTDIAKFKNPEHSDDVIRNWLRNRSTVEFLGVWERLNNPGFNPVEFKLYLIKEFQRLKDEENDRLKLGWNLQRTLAKINYRIHTDAIKETLIPPAVTPAQANLESLNSVLVRQGLPAPERLLKLNEIAITQMRTLLTEPNVKRLK